MAVLKNRAGVSTSTTGTGTITLGAALTASSPINNAAWQTFAAAGAVNGDAVRYLILDSNGAWEYGVGTFASGAGTLTRPAGSMNGSVLGQKSSTGALLALTGTAQVFITAIAEDFNDLIAPVTVKNVTGGDGLSLSGATGQGSVSAGGASTNIDLLLAPKGTGAVLLPASPALTDNSLKVPTTSYVRSTVRDVFAVRGLVGSTSSTTLTISFTEAMLHQSSLGSVLIAGNTLSINQSSGVGVNGSDAALTDGDVSFYAIWNATTSTLAGICSNNNPVTGPLLPSGYTHWGYLTTVKRTGGAFPVVSIRGNRVYYASTFAVVSGGNSYGAWTAVNVSGAVPAIALNIMANLHTVMVSSGGGAAGLLTAISAISGFQQFLGRMDAVASASASVAVYATLQNLSQNVYYNQSLLYNLSNIASNLSDIYVIGYEVPNSS